MSDRETLERLTPITTRMIHLWDAEEKKKCYQLYFALPMEERWLVRECFKGLRRHPVLRARRSAQGIYAMLRKNFEKEVHFMVDTLRELLWDWLCNAKDKFYAAWSRLSLEEQKTHLGALAEVISESTSEEFRQAAKDIPVFLQSKG